ncbi:DUF4838 domain-containing protein [Paenibacillus sp. LMG 31458]|uniref:DUF4838 domain-containing protein n=1 Tax=Paenibacillus phytorum TaxID=2654977 RepID=A0ABX1XPD6_9BACL|nr:DUF4838 domain-containing protein [Paenibacillus phytorum]NOU70383.1 DUF4838 domain-containing protein [Paenibacillus phytorum]
MRRKTFLKWLTVILVLIFFMQVNDLNLRAYALDQPSLLQENELTFVDNHQTKSVIIWWSKNSNSEIASYAASELQNYARKMAGATIPVLEGKITAEDAALAGGLSSAIIVVTGEEASQYNVSGQTADISGQWLASAATKLSDAKEDSFLAEVSGTRLVLAGSNDRGTLYSAYDLLEKLGVKFFAPNFDFYEGNAEYVPSTRSITVSASNTVIQPSFKIRRKYVEEGWSHSVDNLPQLVDWMTKVKLNTLVVPYDYIAIGKTKWDDFREQLIPELKKRGITVEVGGHGFESFLRKDKYQTAHPTWFPSGSNVFNVADDTAVNAYVDEVITYLKGRPEIGIFDAWPPDSATWPSSAYQKFGSESNAYAYVVKKLYERVRNELPGVRIEAIAYDNYTSPPTKYMYDNSIIIDFAPYGRSYVQTIFDPNSTTNKSYINQINQWRSVFNGDLSMYEYYRRYAFHSLPFVLPQLIGQEMPYYRTLGIAGIGTYSEPGDWIPFEITHYILAKLSWNADLNAQTLIDEYVQSRYGLASGEMSQYFQLVEEAGRAIFSQPAGNYNNLINVTKMRDNYLQAKTQLDNAQEKAVSGTSTAYMLQRLAWNIDYAIADTEVEYYRLKSDTNSSKTAKLRAQDAIYTHRFDGIMLQNIYSMRRYISGLGTANANWMYDVNRGKLKYAPMVTTMAPNQTNFVSNMVDGNEGTVFWSNSSPGIGDYVGIELQAVSFIKSIHLSMATGANPNEYIRNGVVEISTDFKEWKAIATVTDQPEIQLSVEAGTQAKYIRIRTTATQTQKVIIREFSVEVAVDRTPPVTTVNVTSSVPDGKNGWNVNPVTVSLDVYDDLSGVARTEYSLDGGAAWLSYTSPVTFSQDGKYTISYRSIDNAGNIEMPKTVSFKLDAIAPTITVTGLVYGTYSDSVDITPIIVLSDDLSGVDNSKTTVMLDTYVVQQGITIPLYTLPLGLHELIVTSGDLAGNAESQMILFQTTTNSNSLKSLVTYFANAGWIDNAGIANSLQSKLDASNFAAFVNEVNAQSGKHITSQAASYLLRDAQYLLSLK